MMIYYFGFRLVAIVTILMIVFSILNGLLVEWLVLKATAGNSSTWRLEYQL